MGRPALFAAALAGSGLAAPGPAAGEGDPARGETLFRPCAACHMIGPGAVNRIGPHLNGILDRPIASVEGFAYSDAMSEAGAGGRAWDDTALDNFLAAPRNYVPGTAMVFRGVHDAGDRADLVAYMDAAGTPDAAPAADAAPSPEVAAILALDGDAAYGAYLSSECTACHAAGGSDIPAIDGLPPELFAAALVAYRDRSRDHQVMNTVTARLGDEEIAALTAHFASAD
ncbi:c-type cytochrome [Rhodobacterales bacterium HKCCE2091]|nr:c-type cytochrome [Rhodobacterales bacterium HKCCE2091]